MPGTTTPVAPAGGFQQGGWYNGQQYWNGTFSAPGVINSQSNQPGAGQAVNPLVVAATNAQQGLAPGTNEAYIAQQTANPANPVNSGVPSGTSTSAGATGAGGTVNLGTGTAPTFDLVAATTAAYGTPEIQAANKAITDRQTALNTAMNEINDNPFYSEATRVGKVAQLTDEANADIKVQQDILTNLKADAQIKVAAQQGQYNINEQSYQDSLTRFNSVLSNGGLDNASATDIANYAIQTGIPTSVLQSMQTASKNKDNPLSLVNSTNDAGDVTILAVDKQGKVVTQTTIPGAGATKNTGTTSQTEQIKLDQAQAPAAAYQAAKSGKTLPDLIAFYGQYGMTPQQVYDVYRSVDYYHATPDQQKADQDKYNVK